MYENSVAEWTIGRKALRPRPSDADTVSLAATRTAKGVECRHRCQSRRYQTEGSLAAAVKEEEESR